MPLDPAAVAAKLQGLYNDLGAGGVHVTLKGDLWYWGALAWLIKVATFGKAGGAGFLSGYATTIGHTIALPNDWPTYDAGTQLILLTHEAHHIAQFDEYGVFLMALGYFLPLPVGLAYGRYAIERAAYVAGYKAGLEIDPSRRAAFIDHGVTQMTSASYGWTFPFPKTVRKWFEAHL